MHLPRGRHATPWSRRAVVLVAFLAAALAPLWLNPVLLNEQRRVSPLPTLAQSPLPTPDVSAGDGSE